MACWVRSGSRLLICEEARASDLWSSEGESDVGAVGLSGLGKVGGGNGSGLSGVGGQSAWWGQVYLNLSAAGSSGRGKSSDQMGWTGDPRERICGSRG